MGRQKQFKDFIEAISSHPPGGEPPIVIGGQAVNFWCEQALPQNPQLAQYAPFTSKDLDVVAQNREQTLAIKKATKLKLVEQEQQYSTIDRAAFIDPLTNQTVIQVLSTMFGLKEKEVVDNSAKVTLADDATGTLREARIANRTSLLKGKIELALASDRVRSPSDKEHDRFHIRLLIICLASTVKNLVSGIPDEQTEREVIKVLKHMMKVISSARAQKVAKIDPSICWGKAIPPELLDLDNQQYPVLSRYFNSSIQKWLEDVS